MLFAMLAVFLKQLQPLERRGRTRGRRPGSGAGDLRAAVWFLALAAAILQPRAGAQSSGLEGSAQPPITPAASAPTGENSQPQSMFPQAAMPAVGGPARGAGGTASPLASSFGGGLGYGPIRPGDIVEVRVFGAPEYSISMPVSSAGDIALPYAGIFHIEGMTATESAGAIDRFYEERQILRNPQVIVTTQQFGYFVTVLGEVHTPGMYPLTGRKRLFDVLSEAGGLTDRAGHVIDIFDPDSTKGPHTVIWDPSLRENRAAETVLKNGDTVMVSRCGVVYVGGNVVRPGAFPICDSNHTTLSEVVAEAQGVKPSSWPQRSLLLRSTQSGTRLVQKIRLNDVLQGKRTDIFMQPDDIVYVPASSAKSATKFGISAAVAFMAEAMFFIY